MLAKVQTERHFKISRRLILLQGCDKAIEQINSYHQIKAHIIEHGEETILQAGYDLKSIFGENGNRIIQQVKSLTAQEKKIELVQQMLEPQNRNSQVSASLKREQPGQPQHVDTQHKKNNCIGQVMDKQSLSNEQYRELLYSTLIPEINSCRQQAKTLDVLNEFNSDLEIVFEERKYCYQKFELDSLAKDSRKLSEFSTIFKFITLNQKLDIKGAQQLSHVLSTPKNLYIATKRFIQNFRSFMVLSIHNKQTMIGLLKIAKALNELHENYIVHRNICPEIIHVEKSNKIEIQISGFGYATATIFESYQKPHSSSIYQQQKEKWAYGSENHDLYAFGVILAETFKGQDYFKQKIKNQNDLKSLVKQLIAEKSVHSSLKAIWEGTILRSEELLTAKRICEILTLHLSDK